MRFSDRMSLLGTESAFEVLVKARALEAQGKDVVHLEIGEPDFDTPAHIVEAGQRALAEGYTHYGPSAGLPELREALRTSINQRYQFEPEDLLVTAGVSGGLALAMLALLDPGDEVLVPDPYFVSYKQLAHLAGAKPVFYDTYPHWRPNVQEMESLVTPRSAA